MAGLLEDGTAAPDTGGGLFGLPANFDIGDALGHLYSRVKSSLAPDAPLWPLDSPVGTERVGDQSVGMPDPNVSLQLDRGWGGDRNPTAAEAEAMARGTQTAFGTMAAGAGGDAAEMPSSGPVALASRRVRAPGAGPRPPEPSAPPDAGLLGIRAFHGSPADFNAFSDAYIGTGEGAQAYGYGHYAAESEGVARSYRDALGPGAAMDVLDRFLSRNRGINLRPEEITQGLQGTSAAHIADNPEAINAIQKLLPDYLPNAAVTGESLQHYRKLDDLVNANAGHMYELNINADPEHFLDWDKPLSEQHDKVVSAIADLAAKKGIPMGNATGARAYEDLSNPPYGTRGHGVNDPAALSEALRDAGIPGIKYLDQGSRAASRLSDADRQQLQAAIADKQRLMADPRQQRDLAMHQADLDLFQRRLDEADKATHNYVIFDPKTIEILRKYGIAGLMAGGGAAAVTQRQDQ